MDIPHRIPLYDPNIIRPTQNPQTRHPLRPIISSIGSTIHKIAHTIAKILTPLLSTINPSHVKNSGDLLNKIENINVQNKTMSSLDIPSLFTNIPIKNASTFLLLIWEKTFDSLLSINTLTIICKHITNMTYFKFNNKFYKQKHGLPVGNPLSGVLACLFL